MRHSSVVYHLPSDRQVRRKSDSGHLSLFALSLNQLLHQYLLKA